MTEACKNSSQRSSCCLTGWMRHRTLEGRKNKEQSQPSEGILWAQDVPVFTSHRGLCPHQKLERDVCSLSGNWETARGTLPVEHELMLHILFLRNEIITQLIQHFPQKTQQPEVYFLESCLGLLESAASESLRDWSVCSSYPYTVVGLILMRAGVGPWNPGCKELWPWTWRYYSHRPIWSRHRPASEPGTGSDQNSLLLTSCNFN